MDFAIRAAEPDDAAAAAEIIARAIRITCVAHHENVQEKSAGWLEDKSQTNVAFLIGDPSSACFVAERADEVVGFAAMSADKLLLLYVDRRNSHKSVLS